MALRVEETCQVQCADNTDYQLMLFELSRDVAIIKKKNKKTETVLHIAIEFRSIEIFKYLTIYPSPKLTLALTSHLRQNCYFGEW